MIKWIKFEDEEPPENEDLLFCVDGEIIGGSKNVAWYSYKDIPDIIYNYVTLPSHGCGCCSDDDPLPTHWARYNKPEGLK